MKGCVRPRDGRWRSWESAEGLGSSEEASLRDQSLGEPYFVASLQDAEAFIAECSRGYPFASLSVHPGLISRRPSGTGTGWLARIIAGDKIPGLPRYRLTRREERWPR
jgi:hypothetical protein